MGVAMETFETITKKGKVIERTLEAYAQQGQFGFGAVRKK